METNIGLWYVFVINLCIVFTVSIVQKVKFVIQNDKRIAALTYGEAIRDSTVECAMICQHSENCSGANYLAETRTCYLFNQTCFGTEDAPGWKYLRQAKRTFLYIANQSLSWDGAKSYCESMSGGLANVFTTADHEMILCILNQYGNPKHQIWLGGSDRVREREWVWSNGFRFDDQDFSIWIPGQPSNYGGNEHCLQLKYLK